MAASKGDYREGQRDRWLAQRSGSLDLSLGLGR